MISLEDVLAESKKNNRICPQPKRWQELYEMLPNKKCADGKWEPAVPLILAAWWDTPALPKTIRLQEHIKWAAANGCINDIYNFLRALPEEQWYHLGE